VKTGLRKKKRFSASPIRERTTHADTPVGQLTYSGQVQDCTGDINAMETTLSCEVYLGARQSEATVTDPQGNNDSLFFPPDPCTDGACPGSPGCP
jgi:hypothetical protein